MMEINQRSQIALKFFQFLDNQNIEYCVVGNIISFPFLIDSDIDIIVEEKVKNEIPEIVYQFCKYYKLKLIQILKHEFQSWFCVINFQDKTSHDNVFLHLDLSCDFVRFGKLFLRSKEILINREKVWLNKDRTEYYYKPSPEMAFIYYFLKKIDKLYLSTKQSTYLQNIWESKKEQKKYIKKFYPKSYIWIIEALNCGSWEKISKNVKMLQKEHRKTIVFSLQNYFSEYLRIVDRIKNPTGFFIVFLGVDGSGKTTVISRLNEKLKPAFRNIKYYHLRPMLFTKNSEKIPPTINPHANKPRGKLISIIKIIYWYFDYIIGYYFTILPAKLHSTMISFDRYFHDLLIDPKRYRYGFSRNFIRLISVFIPKPDLWILLDSTPEVLSQRKNELDFDELTRQCLEYKEFFKRLPLDKSVVINSSGIIDRVTYDVENSVIRILEKRTKKRYFNSK